MTTWLVDAVPAYVTKPLKLVGVKSTKGAATTLPARRTLVEIAALEIVTAVVLVVKLVTASPARRMKTVLVKGVKGAPGLLSVRVLAKPSLVVKETSQPLGGDTVKLALKLDATTVKGCDAEGMPTAAEKLVRAPGVAESAGGGTVTLPERRTLVFVGPLAIVRGEPE